jgi:hypothetical protein
MFQACQLQRYIHGALQTSELHLCFYQYNIIIILMCHYVTWITHQCPTR